MAMAGEDDGPTLIDLQNFRWRNCDVCGAMVLSSPMTLEIHEKWHEEQEARLLPSPIVNPEPTIETLSDLVRSIWLGMGRLDEIQLTTFQKELLYDVLETDPVFADDEPMERWWR